jgi:hypothetical protein
MKLDCSRKHKVNIFNDMTRSESANNFLSRYLEQCFRFSTYKKLSNCFEKEPYYGTATEAQLSGLSAKYDAHVFRRRDRSRADKTGLRDLARGRPRNLRPCVRAFRT